MVSGHAVVGGRACAKAGVTASAEIIRIAVPITRIIALPASLSGRIAPGCSVYEDARRYAQKNHRHARLGAAVALMARAKLRRSVEFFGRAAGCRQEAEKTVVASVFGRMTFHIDLVADLDGVFLPSAPGERGRASAFYSPHNHLALGVLGFQIDPNVRIQPLHFH